MSILIKPSTGSGPNKKVLAYIATNDPGCGKEFKPGLCRVRHIAAKLREARGMRMEYEPCAYCPHFIAQQPEQVQALCTNCGTRPQVCGHDLCRRCQENPRWVQEKKKTMSKKTETCNNCSAPITPLRKRKSGLCKSCYSKEYKYLARVAKRAQCPATAKVTQEKSNVTLSAESNTQARWRRIAQADIDAENRASEPINLEPFRELLALYRQSEKELAEDAEEVKARLDTLVDRQRVAKRYADELEKVIQELES